MFYRFRDSTNMLINLKQIACIYCNIEHEQFNINITFKSGSEIVLYYGDKSEKGFEYSLQILNSDLNTVTSILTDKHPYISRHQKSSLT